MVFSSVTFLFLFLPVSLILYYIVPQKLKNFVLLLCSLVFYAWGEPIYVLLMIYSILLNYVSGLLMANHPKYKKQVLVFTIVLNLFIIGFFKYYGFLMENFNALTGLNIPIRKLALPIGISFYTFQALSYDIDLYRGKFPVQKNFVAFAAYITMFPQLIAGPIVRYEDVAKQMMKRKLSLSRFGKGALRFIFGLSKKVLLANVVGALFDTIHASGTDLSVVTAWIGALAYTFQIYFDFSGYSDMAIGLGEMLGFSFMENFDYPYAADSVTDFWRRWHISLSTWFREYVYIPLGGNRVNVIRHIRNILIVWFLTGLWHGASWNFILWGLYYGLLLLFEKYVWSRIPMPRFINRILTLLLVIIGWVIFSSDTLPQILSTLGAMFGKAPLGFFDSNARYYLSTNWVLLVVCVFCALPGVRLIYKSLKQDTLGRVILWILAAVLLTVCTAFMVSQSYNPFLYFRF